MTLDNENSVFGVEMEDRGRVGKPCGYARSRKTAEDCQCVNDLSCCHGLKQMVAILNVFNPNGDSKMSYCMPKKFDEIISASRNLLSSQPLSYSNLRLANLFRPISFHASLHFRL